MILSVDTIMQLIRRYRYENDQQISRPHEMPRPYDIVHEACAGLCEKLLDEIEGDNDNT